MQESTAVQVLETLRKKYGEIRHYLNFSNPLELMVAAILSPQVRDEIVNAATPSLFKEYKTAKDYANATAKDLLKHISKISFAGKKAEHIIAACKILDKEYSGKVPKTLDELTQLPGIGKKTGIVILSHAYNIVEGVAVDTHVRRLSQRIGLTTKDDPVKIEQDLMKLFPKKKWFKLTYVLINHGRAICTAKNRKCAICPIKNICPSSLA